MWHLVTASLGLPPVVMFGTPFFASDPLARQQTRRGLLKSEEMNAFARQVAYGKQGKITARDI